MKPCWGCYTSTSSSTMAWFKTFDWDAMDRLYELGLIGDPKSKAKSVPLTAEGVTLAKESFRKRFALQ